MTNETSAVQKMDFSKSRLKNSDLASFKTEVKKAIFDGAAMDKTTFAILKGFNANLDQVTII